MGNGIMGMLIFVVLMVPFVCVGYYLRKKRDEILEKSMNGPVERQTSVCPYCGHVQTKFWEVRNPACWTCGECHRIWGDTSRMTEEEYTKKIMIDAACYNVEHFLPNLQEIINAVSERSGALDGTVYLKDGHVWYYGGGKPKPTVIADYSEEIVPTKEGRTHVAHLCLEHCRKKHSDANYYYFDGWFLADSGLAWEWKKKE